MPPRPKPPQSSPPKQTSPPESQSPEKTLIEKLLDVHLAMVGETDAVLVFDVRLVSRSGSVYQVSGASTLPGLLSAKRMSESPNILEGHLHSLITAPFVGAMQERVETAALDTVRVDDDAMFTPPRLASPATPAEPATDDSGDVSIAAPSTTISDVREIPVRA